MGMTFQHAYVTFCALASTSSHQSFLKRASSLGVHFKSSVQPKVSGIYLLRTSPSYDPDDTQEQQSLKVDLEASRWIKRGWTFQEACLSSRTLFFGSSRIHFACGTSFWSESQSVIHTKNNYWHKPELLDVLDSFQRGVIELETLYEYWREIAFEYNRRQLTYPTDKLPAIASLAQYISEASGDSYEAGMWRQDMVSELMWVSPGHLKNIPLKDWIETLGHPVPYIAPSWSWASSNRYLEFRLTDHARKLKPECQIEDISVDKDRENPFGQVRSGTLTLIGRVLPLVAVQHISHHIKQTPSKFPLRSVDERSIAIIESDWTFHAEEESLQHLMLLLLCSVEQGYDDTESLDDETEDDNDEPEDEEMENFSDEGDDDSTSPPDDERKDEHPNDSDEEDLDSEASDESVDSDLVFVREPLVEGSTQGLILYPANAGQFYRVGLFYKGRGMLNEAFRDCEARTISII